MDPPLAIQAPRLVDASMFIGLRCDTRNSVASHYKTR